MVIKINKKCSRQCKKPFGGIEDMISCIFKGAVSLRGKNKRSIKSVDSTLFFTLILWPEATEGKKLCFVAYLSAVPLMLLLYSFQTKKKKETFRRLGYLISRLLHLPRSYARVGPVATNEGVWIRTEQKKWCIGRASIEKMRKRD